MIRHIQRARKVSSTSFLVKRRRKKNFLRWVFQLCFVGFFRLHNRCLKHAVSGPHVALHECLCVPRYSPNSNVCHRKIAPAMACGLRNIFGAYLDPNWIEFKTPVVENQSLRHTQTKTMRPLHFCSFVVFKLLTYFLIATDRELCCCNHFEEGGLLVLLQIRTS